MGAIVEESERELRRSLFGVAKSGSPRLSSRGLPSPRAESNPFSPSMLIDISRLILFVMLKSAPSTSLGVLSALDGGASTYASFRTNSANASPLLLLGAGVAEWGLGL